MPAHAHHAHAPEAQEGKGRLFAVGIALNLAFVAAEWAFGVLADDAKGQRAHGGGEGAIGNGARLGDGDDVPAAQ